MKVNMMFLILFFNSLYGQKCQNLIQNIDMNGHFNISIIDDNEFKIDLKDSVTTITAKDLEFPLEVFQKKFPEIYDGKCLKIKDENYSSKEFLLCDKKLQKEFNEEERILFGSFKIKSTLENYYIFQFSGFEIGGSFIFDSETKSFYGFGSEPIFSKDRKFIYGYSNDYNGFNLNVLELNKNSSRNMIYRLGGIFEVKKLKLVQFKNTLNYELLIDLDEIKQLRNDDGGIMGKDLCSIKIAIN